MHFLEKSALFDAVTFGHSMEYLMIGQPYHPRGNIRSEESGPDRFHRVSLRSDESDSAMC